MPYIVRVENHKTLDTFMFKDNIKRKVERALLDGQTVELHLSRFTDPGGDFCILVINGEIVEYVNGY